MNNFYETLTTLWTPLEVKLGIAAGLLWSAFSFAVGGIDEPIEALAILMALDILTGLAAGWKSHSLRSLVGTKGLFKKAGIFVCILIGFLLDTTMNLDVFRDMLIAGFALIEGMSLIENIDRMGYGYIIPAFLREKLKQIADEKKLHESEEK